VREKRNPKKAERDCHLHSFYDFHIVHREINQILLSGNEEKDSYGVHPIGDCYLREDSFIDSKTEIVSFF